MDREEELARELNKLKSSSLRETVDARVKEFEDLGRKGNQDWFSEMCFCVLTANCSAQSGIKAQQYIGAEGFMKDSEMNLIARLKSEMGVLLISHRMNMIKNLSDYIYVIEDTVIKNKGTHDELIRADNLYKRFLDDFY